MLTDQVPKKDDRESCCLSKLRSTAEHLSNISLPGVNMYVWEGADRWAGFSKPIYYWVNIEA